MQVSTKIWSAFLIYLMTTSSLFAQLGWMPGVAPSLELGENLAGINIRAYYGVNDHFCFGPEATFFPKTTIDDNYKLSISEFNFNGHYAIELAHRFGIYPLAGINYTIEQKEENRLDGLHTEQEEALGINYGAGFHYSLGRTFLFAEFKGVSGKLNDEFITIGAFVLLKKPKQKTEDH